MPDLERNKQAVMAFYDLMFNQCRPREAIELYAGADYIQHNPGVANGKEGFIAYFEEALDPPPPELEATQADLAGLLAWIAKAETDAARSRLIGQALDAIDDGLAGDAVVARLSEARRGLGSEANEQADAIDLLAQRVRELGRTSAAGEAAPSV